MAEPLKVMEQEGVGHLYVSSSDRLKVINKISLTIIDKITDSLKTLEVSAPTEKKVAALSKG